MRQRVFLFLLPLIGGLMVLGAIGSPEVGAEDSAGTDIEMCATCHEDQATILARRPHSLLDSDDWAGGASLGSCNYCHGDASAHMDAGGGEGNIFAFTADDGFRAKSDVCQTCHADSHPNFMASSHAAAAVGCTDCHSVHDAHVGGAMLQLADAPVQVGRNRIDAASASCASCHANVLTQFEFNERHRLQEGILSCSSCHNPHEPEARLALGGFKQQACTDCHADKEGPFVFEHGSGMVDGCTSCHTPHGSPNRHMLTFQAVGEQCYSCHAAVPGFHSRFTLDSNCTNCHSTIHGSNFDPYFLK